MVQPQQWRALLLAPKSGKELRDELAAQADDFLDMASDYTEMAKEKSTELTSIAKRQKRMIFHNKRGDLAGNVKQTVSDATADAGRRIRRYFSDIERTIS